jgi:hypothetical protein
MRTILKAVPMRERRDQDDALSVRETSTREPTDGTVKVTINGDVLRFRVESPGGIF